MEEVLNIGLDWNINKRVFFLEESQILQWVLQDVDVLPVVASGIDFALVYCGNSISTRDPKRINKFIKKAGDIIGLKMKTWVREEQRLLGKYSHLLHDTLQQQRKLFFFESLVNAAFVLFVIRWCPLKQKGCFLLGRNQRLEGTKPLERQQKGKRSWKCLVPLGLAHLTLFSSAL